MEHIKEEIATILESFGPVDDKPFLKHLEYFSGKDGITMSSIGDKWSDLSKEHWLKTYTKGWITVKGANYSMGNCPHMCTFDSNTMMCALKHPCDTGIVNKDGSIDRKALKKFIKDSFLYDEKSNSFLLTESKMKSNLGDYVERDSELSTYISWNMPSYKTVASAEWNDFFLNYTDVYYYDDNKEDERAVTLKTFLQFYYVPEVLYKRVLGGELPVTM